MEPYKVRVQIYDENEQEMGDADVQTSADLVFFDDGETFQEKYDKGELRGQRGDTGARGEKGDTGAVGPKGDTGAAGPKGDTGAKGVSLRVKGDWGSGIAYVNDSAYIDVVSYSGSSYACIKSHTSSSTILPTNATYWKCLARKGDTGATGPKGDTGATGPKGATGATGATGPAGKDGDSIKVGTTYASATERKLFLKIKS